MICWSGLKDRHAGTSRLAQITITASSVFPVSFPVDDPCNVIENPCVGYLITRRSEVRLGRRLRKDRMDQQCRRRAARPRSCGRQHRIRFLPDEVETHVVHCMSVEGSSREGG